MKLADKLIELRKEKGWSQEEFAEKLDVSRQAVSRWENETALPDAQNILRISKLFNVTTDYLLNEDNEGRADAPAVETADSKIGEEARLTRKKKYPYWYLILVTCLVIVVVCLLIKISIPANEEHHHTALSSVKENEVAPTCTSDGSYDEVVYCADCNKEIMRTTRSVAKLAHTLLSSVKENEVDPTCKAGGSYDEVVYCADCSTEIMRTKRSVLKLPHTLLSSVKENEVDPTCKAGGSYDEVVYCSTCNHAVVRTRRETRRLDHQYKDGQCMSCDQPQPSEGLMYMSNGNGTCFVTLGDCTDEDIVIPDYSPSGEKVVQIKAYAFLGNTRVKSVRIPETVTTIGEGAFEDCVELERVNLPSKIKMIDSYTFNGCKKLKEITIPAGVYYIGEEAFADCVSVESIFIPASVMKIGKFAFKNFSGCDGTVTFEIYAGWKLYDDSENMVGIVDFENGTSTPVQYLTVRFADYKWKRG